MRDAAHNVEAVADRRWRRVADGAAGRRVGGRPAILRGAATRVVIYALIATSLNLLIGYVGLVSFATPPLSAPAPARSPC